LHRIAQPDTRRGQPFDRPGIARWRSQPCPTLHDHEARRSGALDAGALTQAAAEALLNGRKIGTD
jgi:hypothetical protein